MNLNLKTFMLPSHRVISPIVKMHFAGWESDTLTLQQNGWELSVNQEMYGQNMTIAMRHPEAKVIFYSNPIECKTYLYRSSKLMHGNVGRVITENTRILLQNVDLQKGFEPVDAIPSIVEMKEMSYADFNMFRPAPMRTDELVVKPEEVGMWIKRIKEAQGEKQKEIREKIRKGRINLEPAPEHTVHAQIISLAA